MCRVTHIAYTGVILTALFMSGCASIVSGNSQDISVITDPPGAVCELKRDGKAVTVISPTPDSAHLSKSVGDMNVICRKDEFEETHSILKASVNGWGTAGNILAFGLLLGPIAMGIDVASGAMGEYPETLVVRLIPKIFPDIAARDRIYNEWVAAVRKETDKKLTAAKNGCRVSSNCKSRMKEIEAARDTEIAALEEKRKRAIIGSAASQSVASSASTTEADDAPTGTVVTAPVPASPLPDGTIVLDAKVGAALTQYLSRRYPVIAGFGQVAWFAVSEDGTAYDEAFCDSTSDWGRCYSAYPGAGIAKTKTLEACQARFNSTCVIAFSGHDEWALIQRVP